MLKSSLPLLLLLANAADPATLLGWVQSPGYPGGYPPHASLSWSRCAPRGHTVSLRLIHLDLEDSHDCDDDAVQIFSNQSLISVLCGRMRPEELDWTVNPTLRSPPGGCLSLSFHSDFSNTRRHTGFRGFYTLQDFDECTDDLDNRCTQFCHNFVGGYSCSCRHGYHLDTDRHTCTVSCSQDLSGQTRGQISSPAWPNAYAENARCRYALEVDAHLQLQLDFKDFDVEESADRGCIDAVTIQTHLGVLGPFCGHVPPPSPLLTHSHRVTVLFTSDGFGSNKGFVMQFGIQDKVCVSPVTPRSSMNPPKSQYKQGETVTVTCDVGHFVNSDDLEPLTSQYVATCDSSGVWLPAHSCDPVDCGVPFIPKDSVLALVGGPDVGRTQYQARIQFNCTSSFYRLEGDDTYTCNSKGEWESVGGHTEIPICKEDCGVPLPSTLAAGRIMGGTAARKGQIPWQLLIKRPRRGGASLISDRWAVTAAHVVENLEESSVILYGGLVEGQAADAVELQSEKIIIHPGYVQGVVDRTSYDNDIALIRFSTRVNLNWNLLPVCLPVAPLTEDDQGSVSGFGMTLKGTSRNLLYTSIGLYPEDKCQQTHHLKPGEPMVYTQNMFCAGAENKDSCKQDSGGPFVVPILDANSGPFYLAGIVSWGPPCSRKLFIGYYTKVHNYVDWIRDTVEKTEKSLAVRA